MSKFETNRVQKPAQYLVNPSLYQDVMKEPPPSENMTCEEIDGVAEQLASWRLMWED